MLKVGMDLFPILSFDIRYVLFLIVSFLVVSFIISSSYVGAEDLLFKLRWQLRLLNCWLE